MLHGITVVIFVAIQSQFVYCIVLGLKLNVGNIQRYTLVTLYPKAPLSNIIIIGDTVLRQKRNFKHEK